MSKKTFQTGDLQVGMYVELPGSWFSHDFVSNNFKIKDLKQLAEIKKLKLSEVEVDLERSEIAEPLEQVKSAAASPVEIAEEIETTTRIADPKYQEVPKKWSSDKLMTDDLRNVLEDHHLGPEQKSAVVYQHSLSMMEQLLEFPTAENIQASKEAIYALSDTVLAEQDTAKNLLRITSHDFYTYTHSVNVGLKSIMLSKALFQGSDAHDLRELAAGFFLHDLGKVNIDPDVLNKPGRLNDLEMRHIRTHPYQGYKLLADAEALTEECKVIVMQHHEAFDGTGYPRRLKGEEIHLYGKICAIADIFDALTAERSYKKAMKPFEALTLMKDQMINRVDRKLFTEFVQLF